MENTFSSCTSRLDSTQMTTHMSVVAKLGEVAFLGSNLKEEEGGGEGGEE